jgi:MtfA peptidase
MQIIYKLDKLFIIIYSSLILAMGIAFTAASGNLLFLIAALAGEMIYLLLALKHPVKRYRALKKAMPEEWKTILSNCSAFYRNLDADGTERFERDVRMFLSSYPVQGIRGQEIDIKLKLLVASGFATLLHGRPRWEPPIKDGVLVYPGERFSRDYEVGKGNRAGQATPNSPLIITEGSLRKSFQYPEDGYNVIYHELAHYFDMEDGVAEGIPSARLLPGKLFRWKTIIHDEWRRALQGYSFLGSYAGTNEAEAFAVAVEFFFENPVVMNANNPQLYNALKEFFNVDTLAIINRDKQRDKEGRESASIVE